MLALLPILGQSPARAELNLDRLTLLQLRHLQPPFITIPLTLFLKLFEPCLLNCVFPLPTPSKKLTTSNYAWNSSTNTKSSPNQIPKKLKFVILPKDLRTDIRKLLLISFGKSCLTFTFLICS